MKTLAIAILLALQEPPKDEQAEQLRSQWTGVLDLCRRGDRDGVQKAIAAMETTREEMAALFGEEKAAKIHPRYAETWKTVLADAAADLIERCGKAGWDAVDVICINTVPEKDRTEIDRGVMAALADKEARVYNVRLKVKDKPAGYLLRGFVRTKAGWRMLLKIGKTLAEK